MKENFTIEKWLKEAFQVLKINWLEWLKISTAMSILWIGIFYFFYREVGLAAIEMMGNSGKLESLAMLLLGKLSLFLALIFLFVNFSDLYMIHVSSQWLTGKRLSMEETIAKVFYSMPISILMTIVYSILATIAFFFCVIPLLFVVVYFLFIYQALILEDKGFGSFGRSIELVKPNLSNLIVLPFLISFAMQFSYTLPYYFIQALVELFIDRVPANTGGDTTALIETLLRSPYIVLIFAPGILFFVLQANLKSILYTIAFEQAKGKEISETQEDLPSSLD